MTPRRPYAFIFLLLALVFAQQAALLHGVWHAGQDVAHTAHAVEDVHPGDAGHDTHQAALCPLDHALGSVLGVIYGGVPHVVQIVSAHVAPLPAVQSDCCIRARAPVSRGPPAPLPV